MPTFYGVFTFTAPDSPDPQTPGRPQAQAWGGLRLAGRRKSRPEKPWFLLSASWASLGGSFVLIRLPSYFQVSQTGYTLATGHRTG
ncbi:hypothetical protein BDW60DRAFT_207579 [Aspergillus nidulans var. acristatus]